jgi:alpha-tubulin suppressor-like RCC1 family protein
MKTFRIKSWGTGMDGQLGSGILIPQFQKSPLLVKNSNHKLISFGGGVTHSVAVFEDNGVGKIHVWGCNYFGQCGHFAHLKAALLGDRTDNILEPLHLEQGLQGINIRKVAVGDYHSLAISSNKDLYAWGAGILGKLILIRKRNRNVFRRTREIRFK